MVLVFCQEQQPWEQNPKGSDYRTYLLLSPKHLAQCLETVGAANIFSSVLPWVSSVGFDKGECEQQPVSHIPTVLLKTSISPYLDCLVIRSIDSLHRHLAENHGFQLLFGKITVVNDA